MKFASRKELKERKQALVKKKKEEADPIKKADRALKRKHWTCFWIWPWGHRWKYESDGRSFGDRYVCEACSKSKFVSSDF